MTEDAQDSSKYKLHQMVRLRNSPAISGFVCSEPIKSSKGWQYEIFFSGQDRRFIIEDDLIPYVELETDERGEVSFGDLDDLLRNLVLVKLRQPLADNLYSLYASRTKFEVYQFKPAIKFLGNPDQRLLIADEVGLGKTIEAGIIYLELQARLDMLRVLVICPSALRYKWQDEMSSRFDEAFTILDADGLRRFLHDYNRLGEHARLRGIVSLELIRREEFAQVVAEDQVHFDLVVIDEAHHCRNTGTLSNTVASVFSDSADAMLMLTATPLHLGNQDLYNLLNILSPGDFDGFEVFDMRIKPNRNINLASRLLEANRASQALKELRKVEHTQERKRFINNPYYQETVQKLTKGNLNYKELVEVQSNLLELNTLAHIFTRTRKREVQDKAPVRSAHTLLVDFTEEEWDFYNSVIEFVRDQYRLTTGNWATGWATIMRERQAASCISAMRDFFTEYVKGEYEETLEDEDAAQGIVDDESILSISDYYARSMASSITNLLDASDNIGETDTKFDVFVDALEKVLLEDPTSKIMVFSFFRGTLNYLYERLRDLHFSMRMIHGGVPIIQRQAIIDDFREDPQINILLSSEVGSEGLDFQFCNTLFNYDLPWNPMKVEQRIGRLDRFGQEHPKIRIYNLVIENSIEERIFLRLYERIGIFEETIGDLEAILGDEIRALSKRIFTTELTPSEEAQLTEQAAVNITRRKQELEEFEKQRLQFMGQDAIFAGQVEETIGSGRFVSEAELRALIETFIKKKFPLTKFEPNEPNDPTYSLIPDTRFVNYVSVFALGRQASGRKSQEFLARLRPKKILPITFSAEMAYQRKLLEFLTLRHPITRAAVEYWGEQPTQGLPVTKIFFKTDRRFVGDFYFFIFAFRFEAMEQRTTLVPVVICMNPLEVVPGLSSNLLRLLQDAMPVPADSDLEFDLARFELAKEKAKQYAAIERDRKEAELQRSNDALVNARLSAIEQTYRIKKRTIEGYIQTVTEHRILRMRNAQLRNIEAKYATLVENLESQRDVSVSFSLELAGLTRVYPKDT